MAIIQPSVLSGFRDFLPSQMMRRQHLMNVAREVYQSFGFAPIDTPVLEKIEILAGKGSEETQRQMYRFQDNGGRDVGMRFDLTVPLARFAAQHINDLGTPFKRFHIAPVWRGERSQRGRYREFVQCDFDTIGTKSVLADTEMVLVIDRLLSQIGFSNFQIRINNRKLLNGILDAAGVQEHSVAVLRALDKLGKTDIQSVIKEAVDQTGIDSRIMEKILTLASAEGDSQTILDLSQQMIGHNKLGSEGVSELRTVIDSCKAAGLQDERIALDVSIARGLDYYTGTIVETFLTDDPTLGSVCSGGRYDNLAGLYTKQDLPGVGASLGLDRLLDAMDKMEMCVQRSSPTEVLIANFDSELWSEYFRWAALIRNAGFKVEIYPETAKIKKQMKYANKHQIPVVLIAGSQEKEHGEMQIKWMNDGTQQSLPSTGELAELLNHLSEKMSN